MAFKRPSQSPSVKAPANEWKDPIDKADHPNIYSFLHDSVYDDGKPRVTGSISIFTKCGCLRASISDKDMFRYCYVEAQSVAELFELIDRAICDEGTEWIASNRTPTF